MLKVLKDIFVPRNEMEKEDEIAELIVTGFSILFFFILMTSEALGRGP